MAVVNIYLEMFEKMAGVLLAADQEERKWCRARGRAILSDLLKTLRSGERRLSIEDELGDVDESDWAFQFEVMIAPLWASCMDVESAAELTMLEFRIFRASCIVHACLPLLRSHELRLSFDDTCRDDVATDIVTTELQPLDPMSAYRSRVHNATQPRSSRTIAASRLSWLSARCCC